MFVALHAAALLFWCCVVFAKVEKKFKFYLSMCLEIWKRKRKKILSSLPPPLSFRPSGPASSPTPFPTSRRPTPPS
jgi:hypothetical protein